MPDIKYSGLVAATVLNNTDLWAIDQSGASKSVTATILRQYIGEGLTNQGTAAGTFAADTYLTGSAISLSTTGNFAIGTTCKWIFDMTKTGAGTATPIINVRAGTLGTTGDASIYSFTLAAGTAVIDAALFEVWVSFATVGSGTSATVHGLCRCTHQLAATGMTTQGASGMALVVPGTSAGFNSTTQSIIGLSFNGGASFSGTNTLVTASADKL